MNNAANGAMPEGVHASAAARWLVRQGRWRRMGVALLAGSVMTLGQAPISQPWALFAAVPVLVWLIDTARCPRAAALSGWAAGFGYFLTGLHWIGYAFLVDAEQFAWLMPFAVTLLPAFLGLFWAAAFGFARWIWPQGRWLRPVALAACVTLVEYARSNVLTGFPWGLPGYVWVETPVMQAAAWVGPYGMTFLTLALSPLLLLAIAERRWAPGLIGLGAVASLWVAGDARLRIGTDAPGGPVLRIVQPNATQKLKWQPEHEKVFYDRLLTATAAPPDPALGPPAAVIWPETAVNFLPAYQPERRVEVAAAAGGVPVILGALHGVKRDGEEQWFNSLMVLLPDGSLGPRYDKQHLVPFGEYLPYESVLGLIGMRQIVRQGGFTPGPGPQLIELPGLPPFSPLICYEMIFPSEVVAQGRRPDWMLQVTNDAWFGAFAGPQQHLAQARIRAIEQGLPVIRSANTGISAAIDAYGRMIAQIPLDTDGYRDVRLTAALPPTPYVRFGDVPAMSLVVLVFFLCTRRRGLRPVG